MKRVSHAIDTALRRIGNVFAWAILLLMVAIVVQVILRYGFRRSLIKLEELQWHLYAVGMMIGLSYAFGSDSHIRVDVLQDRFSKKTKAAIDIAGTLFLLLPFVVFLMVKSLPFVAKAYELQERSNAPSGLPLRWIVKAFIPLGCVLMILAAVAHLMRCVAAWRGIKASDEATEGSREGQRLEGKNEDSDRCTVDDVNSQVIHR